jgi:hypothetical protein
MDVAREQELTRRVLVLARKPSRCSAGWATYPADYALPRGD